jgi:hypothetical protein
MASLYSMLCMKVTYFNTSFVMYDVLCITMQVKYPYRVLIINSVFIWTEVPESKVGQDSVVAIATCYELDGPGIKSLWG